MPIPKFGKCHTKLKANYKVAILTAWIVKLFLSPSLQHKLCSTNSFQVIVGKPRGINHGESISYNRLADIAGFATWLSYSELLLTYPLLKLVSAFGSLSTFDILSISSHSSALPKWQTDGQSWKELGQASQTRAVI